MKATLYLKFYCTLPIFELVGCLLESRVPGFVSQRYGIFLSIKEESSNPKMHAQPTSLQIRQI